MTDDIGAGFGQAERDGAADAAAAAGDDGVFSGKRKAAHCAFLARDRARLAASAMKGAVMPK